MNIAEILRKADVLNGNSEKELKSKKTEDKYAGLKECFKNVTSCNVAGKRYCCTVLYREYEI